MEDIDWSKAPEGSTHCNSRCMEFYRPASNSRGGEFYDRFEGEWAILCDDFTYLVRQPHVIARPVVPTWTGEGLPPAGTVCEYYWSAGDSWRAGTCVAHFDERAVICDADDEGCAERLDAHHVRPIRTPDQIAAEEREKAVAEMQAMIDNADWSTGYSRAFCEMAYDAGYRKTEDKQ